MNDKHLPQAKVDPDLLKHLQANQEVEYTRRYCIMKPERFNVIDDRDTFYNSGPTARYVSKVILSDESVYLLNRLYAYYENYSGVAYLTDWHHIHALIKTYPMLQELWDQFEAALALCGEHEKVKRGKL